MYTYGPLTWGANGNMNNAIDPVGYDEWGIPIDANGNQLLDLDCILHPHHKPRRVERNNYLGIPIPCFATTKKWFTDNFFDITDLQVQKYIVRWLLKGPNGYINGYCKNKLVECGSIEQFRKNIYGS